MKLKAIIPVLIVLFAIIYIMYIRSDTVQSSLILINGVVHTVDDDLPLAEAVAVSNGKIVGVGSTEEILGRYTSDTIIDLVGKPVFPGFIDAHAHLENLGVFLLNVNLVGTGSVKEIQSRLKEHLEKLPPGVWLRGRGWDQNDWESQKFPDAGSLDAVTTDVAR